MVYSTCSIEKEENGTQVAKFVSENKDFSLKFEKQILPAENNDGAYVALLERRHASAELSSSPQLQRM